jgi:hypothetical protein
MANAARKEYETMFALNARLSSEFGKAFASAQKSISDTQREVAALNKAQADVAAYQKQGDAVAAAGKKLSAYKEQLANLQRAMADTEGFSASLANSMVS